MAIPDRHHNDGSIYNIDTRLNEKLRSSLSSMFENNEERLRKLKDVKTLTDCYKKTREYKQQTEEHGILSVIVNKTIEELLKQVEPYYVGSIVKSIGIQTEFKKEEGTVEVNSNINFEALLKPYVEFTIEINKKESYLVRFTFQLDTSAHITKLRFSRNADKGKTANIEKLGIKIELSLLRIEFSDLINSNSHISLKKKVKLGTKKFEIQDLSLYAESHEDNKETTVCPKCNSINSFKSKYCTFCSYNL